MSTPYKSIILISRLGMGQAPLELTTKLLNAYLGQLYTQAGFPDAIFFYGEGVKATVEGSPFLEALGALEKKGVHLGVCTTCLNYFNLMEKIKVGQAGKMEDLVKAQAEAEKVITI